MKNLIEMIKTGRVISNDDLFEGLEFRKTKIVNYRILEVYAFCNNISDEDLNAAIVNHGSSKLLLDALQSTKDCDTFAKAWYDKSNAEPVIKDYVLHTLGYKMENKPNNQQDESEKEKFTCEYDNKTGTITNIIKISELEANFEMSEAEFLDYLKSVEDNLPSIDTDYDYEKESKEFEEYLKMIDESANIKR